MPSLDSPVAIALPQAELTYWPRWADAALAERWLSTLISETPWTQPQIRLYGRQCAVPRLVAWYGDAEARYRYSGLVHEPIPWTPLLGELRERVQAEVGAQLNGVLLNLYRDGQDAMGWHSDDEPELGREPLVVSLNLGATRRFDFRRKGSSRIEYSLALENGSLLVMRGPTQHYWQHQIARTRKVTEPRLNLTFRQLFREPVL
ncbi:alpha-ketoglutarate-dependent dioxygenase AlkB family protein [Stutzerimonas stutzeri]|uniref:alpha-ketoglutarate-dependent dioxygenase AlkB family protein n=1 Tax=Stutzerimonas stutzeri TaxID=316 RepID=UPI001C2E0642|nr:alpha-ketoglutarate-dependent dioxygenase AlkB [Stutzerimonas stutzeri]